MANGFITFSFMIWNSKTWVLIWAVSCENLGGESLKPEDPENNRRKIDFTEIFIRQHCVKIQQFSATEFFREINFGKSASLEA